MPSGDQAFNFVITVQQLLDAKGSDVLSINPDLSAVEAATILSEKNIGVLICSNDDGGIAGILSERDIVRAFSTQSHRISEVTVRELMTSSVVVCTAEDDIHQVMKNMRDGRFRHMPVVQDGILSGIISATDILKFYTQNSGTLDRQSVIDILFSGSSAVYPGA